MKNYPNQASSFQRIRGTLEVVKDLNDADENGLDDEVLGYACAEKAVYTFRNLGSPTAAELTAHIAEEKLKPAGSQGARTFARELRRTLRDMGWVDGDAVLTTEGARLLESAPTSVEEQSLLVAGLLNIAVTDASGETHHPIQTMLKLLAVQPSEHRDGLELALEPKNDSDAEFARIELLYKLDRSSRMSNLVITDYQRANGVKIFPALGVQAGLVIEDGAGLYSLSQDGWGVLGQKPAAAQKSIARRPGRRMTVGKLVDANSVAKRLATSAPRTLTPEEQMRANERLRERTSDHQKLVQRMAGLIGDGDGHLFEDEFSYDLFWAPKADHATGWLYEMKTITSHNDSYKRIRDAVGQLSYYEFFSIAPTWSDRTIRRVAVIDKRVPSDLVGYLTHEGVGAVGIEKDGNVSALNPLGQAALDALPPKPNAS